MRLKSTRMQREKRTFTKTAEVIVVATPRAGQYFHSTKHEELCDPLQFSTEVCAAKITPITAVLVEFVLRVSSRSQ